MKIDNREKHQRCLFSISIAQLSRKVLDRLKIYDIWLSIYLSESSTKCIGTCACFLKKESHWMLAEMGWSKWLTIFVLNSMQARKESPKVQLEEKNLRVWNQFWNWQNSNLKHQCTPFERNAWYRKQYKTLRSFLKMKYRIQIKNLFT